MRVRLRDCAEIYAGHGFTYYKYRDAVVDKLGTIFRPKQHNKLFWKLKRRWGVAKRKKIKKAHLTDLFTEEELDLVVYEGAEDRPGPGSIVPPEDTSSHQEEHVEADPSPGNKTGIVYDELMTAHQDTRSHPECPNRVTVTMDLLRGSQLLACLETITPRDVTRQEALTCHKPAYWEFLASLSSMTNRQLKEVGNSHDSIYVNRSTFTAAKRAAGSLLALTHDVLSRKVRNGAAVIRPPGHHCLDGRPMGFCFLGNVPIACHFALDKFNVNRVLVVDWDVHHGNGTQDMFYEDSRVLYISVHRYDQGQFFPGGGSRSKGSSRMVGEGAGKGYNLNIGWNGAHKSDGDYLAAFHRLILPMAHEFQPELVFISAGFDSGLGDPLGECDVTPKAYGLMTSLIMQACHGKVIVALEGGYNLTTVAEGMESCIEALMGGSQGSIPPIPSDSALQSLDTAKRCISKFWKSLRCRSRSR